MQQHENQVAKATFAAGCFWGVQHHFDRLPGVTATRVGYTGGKTSNPTYKDVCSDMTGHAEAVEVSFDPRQISYEKLLEAFWTMHDPTTLNRQGPDVGSQYRSAVYYHDDDQCARATKALAALQSSRRWPRPIVTAIEAARTFYPAEDYHQKYFEKNGISGCAL